MSVQETEEFWMVYADGRSAPTVKHQTQESADAEARRITMLERRTTFVLKAVAGYTVPLPKPESVVLVPKTEAPLDYHPV